MCNNRCVFCVSGQRTGLGEAKPLEAEPILERVREARAEGHTRITLLGGEPTLQPAFFDVVRECVRLGFDEIVIFTNGAKTARAAFIDDVLATGGRFSWRISIQGATEDAHERTTRKDGSFGRIVRTLESLRDRGERITINMCVVGSNFESVDRFPELLARYGVSQLHLDLARPLDAGERTEDELRAMMPRLSDMVPALGRMVAGFPDTFDVNLGNVPYCVAPELAQWIHHDGEHTDTIAVDGGSELSRPWNKYLVKRRGKTKPDACRECAFDSKCSGVFDEYLQFHGAGELVPVDALALGRSVRARLARLRAGAPFGALRWESVRVSSGGHRVDVTLSGPAGERAVIWLAEDERRATGGYTVDGDATPALVAGLRAALTALGAEAAPDEPVRATNRAAP